MMTAPRTDRVVSPDQMTRLQGWTARKPVIAIMGEFSAGKSTLLNMLIGQQILPTQVTATKLPPVWLRHGTGEPYRVDKQNQRHPIDLNDLSGIPIKDTRYIRIYCESEVLESCDLLDTPGISDPNIPMNVWIKTLGYANAALWCTHAGQAWRESERGTWESLPMRLRKNSILLITRSDKITNQIDKMKIDNRLKRETEDLFSARLFISLTNALRALDGEGDADLWATSGAEAFVERLAGSITSINDERAVSLRRYRQDGSNLQPVLPRRVRPGAIGSNTRPERPAAAEVQGTPVLSSVVPMRGMRVVASNDSPVVETTAPTSRPVLHQVPAEEAAPKAALVLSEPVEHESVWGGELPPVKAPTVKAENPAPSAAENVVVARNNVIQDTFSSATFEDDLPSEDLYVEPSLDDDEEFVAEVATATPALTDLDYEDAEEAVVFAATEAQVESVAEVAEVTTDVEEYYEAAEEAVAEVPAEVVLTDEYGTPLDAIEVAAPVVTFAEIVSADAQTVDRAEVEDSLADDGSDWTEDDMDDLTAAPAAAAPSVPMIDVAALVAEIARGETIEEPPVAAPTAPTVAAPESHTDDAILSVLASFALPEETTEPEVEVTVETVAAQVEPQTEWSVETASADPELSVAQVIAEELDVEPALAPAVVAPVQPLVAEDAASQAPVLGTAATLWAQTLAGRKIDTVQDLLSAMGDFVSGLDASGLLTRSANPAPSGESFDSRAQRRMNRLLRRQRQE